MSACHSHWEAYMRVWICKDRQSLQFTCEGYDCSTTKTYCSGDNLNMLNYPHVVVCTAMVYTWEWRELIIMLQVLLQYLKAMNALCTAYNANHLDHDAIHCHTYHNYIVMCCVAWWWTINISDRAGTSHLLHPSSQQLHHTPGLDGHTHLCGTGTDLAWNSSWLQNA